MDERVTRVKTSQEARQLAKNAHVVGRLDIEAQALEYAKKLQAQEEGYTTPAELAIADVLYTYEEVQSRLKDGTNYRAKRLRGMLKKYGPLQTAEQLALNPIRSAGFDMLEGEGQQDMTIEAIIVKYPDEFSEDALHAARARLNGEVHPRSRNRQSTRVSIPTGPGDAALTPPKFDGEAKMFWRGFKASNKFMEGWLPRYRESAELIKQALLAGDSDELFKTFWRTRDNAIADAGSGQLKFEIADEMRGDLVQVIRDVYEDGSAENFQRIVDRFESLRNGGHISAIPRLLIARVFAGLHPNLYHTTVDVPSQNKVIQWFAEHTGFVPPHKSANWAERAQALVAHMTRIEEIDSDIHIRNMFPWFVAEQVDAQIPSGAFQPGHRTRPPTAAAEVSATRREMDLRHNRLQDILYSRLVQEHGKDNVGTECATGTGGYADAVVKLSEGEFHLYEIKVGGTAAEIVRQAMGQLLEYGYRKGGLNPVKLIAVGEPELDEVTDEFIKRLHREFNLNIAYLRIELNE